MTSSFSYLLGYDTRAEGLVSADPIVMAQLNDTSGSWSLPLSIDRPDEITFAGFVNICVVASLDAINFLGKKLGLHPVPTIVDLNFWLLAGFEPVDLIGFFSGISLLPRKPNLNKFGLFESENESNDIASLLSEKIPQHSPFFTVKIYIQKRRETPDTRQQ